MSKFHSVKESDFIDGICTLAKNTPKLVSPLYNGKLFKIREDSTDETLYIIFDLGNGEHALIGHECHKPKEDSKEFARTDLMCVYSKPSQEIGFAYDLKKTLGGKDVILGLLSQWTETIAYCKTLIKKTDYKFSVGVITEKYNQTLLDANIQNLRERLKESDDSNFSKSSVARKKLVSSINDDNTLKCLMNFQAGKFKIDNLILDIDIQLFDNKKELTLQFNGEVKPRVIKYVTQ